MADNRSDSDAPSRNYPSFVLHYVPEQHANAVLIPPSYIRNFNGVIPEKIYLQNRAGTHYKANIQFVKNWLHITKGWHTFVEGNSIKSGDHIVFSYLRNSVILVKAYGPDATMRQEPLETPTEISSDDNVDDGFYVLQFHKTVNSDLKNVIVPVSVREQCNCFTPQEVKLVNEAGEDVTAVLKPLKDGRVVLGYGAVKNFWQMRGDKLEFNVICQDGSMNIEEIRMKICSI